MRLNMKRRGATMIRKIAPMAAVLPAAVLLVALLLSRALAAPIRQLASLVDRFGREGFGLRSNIKGTAELEELMTKFTPEDGDTMMGFL